MSWSLRRNVAVAALGLSGLVGVVTANAASSQPAGAAAPVGVATAGPAAGPVNPAAMTYSAYLDPNGYGKVKYTPSDHISGPVVTKATCNPPTQTKTTFTVLNRTVATQQFRYAGKNFGPPIAPNSYLYVCVYQPAVFTYGLARHPLVHLTVNAHN